MTGTITVAAAIFVGTDIDDLLFLSVLFMQARNKKEKTAIIAGQALGLAVLFALSAIAGTELASVLEYRTRYLGLIPILLAVFMLVKEKDDREEKPEAGTGWLQVTAISISAGGDNVGVWTPVFATMERKEILATAAVFAAMLALWCLTASKLSETAIAQKLSTKAGRFLVPAIFIAVGLAVLLRL